MVGFLGAVTAALKAAGAFVLLVRWCLLLESAVKKRSEKHH